MREYTDGKGEVSHEQKGAATRGGRRQDQGEDRRLETEAERADPCSLAAPSLTRAPEVTGIQTGPSYRRGEDADSLSLLCSSWRGDARC